MRLQTDHKIYMTVAIATVMCVIPLCGLAQETNPSQYVAITEGNKLVNDQTESQSNSMQKTAAMQGTIAAEFTAMHSWEAKYNSYLKTATGYASAIKAGTTLYADAVQTLQHLYEIQRAVNANPQGIGATLAMNTLYLEAGIELIRVNRILKKTIAVGGSENMLTGAERTELLWQLTEELEQLNKKLRQLAISIAYHNLKDVWNKATAGMIDRNHGTIAGEAMERWKRASKVSEILNGE